MAVGLPAKTTYVDGDVFSASDINDTNGTLNLVGQTTNFYAGKNKIINGNFGVWQRGTSFASSGYTSDRWFNDLAGSVGTVSRQSFTAGTAPVAGYEGTFFLRKSLTTGAQYSTLIQRIEDVRTFAGNTVTLSFWAKGTNPTGNFEANLIQNFGSGGSGDVALTGQAFSVTASWVRYSFTFNVPSISGKTIGTGSYLFTSIYQAAANTSVSTLDIWGVQLEAGSVATAFQTATGTIQGELAACQRYYYRTPADSSNTFTPFGTGVPNGSTAVWCYIQFPQTFRGAAASIDFANIAITNFGGTTYAISAVAFLANRSGVQGAQIVATVSGATAGQFCFISSNSSATGYLGFSAEL
jgi:hypothetical protein